MSDNTATRRPGEADATEVAKRGIGRAGASRRPERTRPVLRIDARAGAGAGAGVGAATARQSDTR